MCHSHSLGRCLTRDDWIVGLCLPPPSPVPRGNPWRPAIGIFRPPYSPCPREPTCPPGDALPWVPGELLPQQKNNGHEGDHDTKRYLPILTRSRMRRRNRSLYRMLVKAVRSCRWRQLLDRCCGLRRVRTGQWSILQRTGSYQEVFFVARNQR